MEELSHLFNKDEHVTCVNYKATLDSGFKYVILGSAEQLSSEFMPRNNLLLLMSGTLNITCDKFPTRQLEAWQMILIPKSAKVEVIIKEESAIVLFGFDVPISTCDKIRFRTQSALCKSIAYDFKPTEIRKPLRLFLNLIADYLSSGLSCVHMHESKHKELFICLKAFYSKEEMAYLLHPIMRDTIDFKSIIIDSKDEFTSVDDMINIVNMSRSRFFIKFKEEFGTTAKQWLLKHQIDKIEFAATIPNITIKELMAEFGFETTAQFVQFCKLHFACTPTELIKRNKAVNQIDR